MDHIYGSHVLRTSLMAASGVWVTAKFNHPASPVSNSCLENVKSVGRRLPSNPQLLGRYGFKTPKLNLFELSPLHIAYLTYDHKRTFFLEFLVVFLGRL